MVDVIYEDNHIIVCIKPQNVPTQQDISGDMDMLSMVKSYIKEKYSKPGNVFVGLVHRLDRPTGGVMVFAKTSKAAKRLSEQISKKQCKKQYLTVVCGNLPDGEHLLCDYLQKDEKNNIVSVVPNYVYGAKKAELKYTKIYNQNNLSLAKVDLFTGRSHQIRVQMKNAGFGVFGDSKYGENDAKNNLALWSYKLSFEHPVTKQKMIFCVLPPQDVKPWNIFEKQLNNLK